MLDIWEVLRSGSRGRQLDFLPSPADVAAIKVMFDRTDSIISYAADNGIRVLMDAEHTYYQPAIDYTVLRMQRKYNKVWM